MTRFIMIEIAILGLGSAVTGVLVRAFSWDVEVSILNGSGQAIREAAVVEKWKRTIVPGPLEPGDTRTIRIRAWGESSYMVEAIFADGRTVRGEEHYIEGAYRCIDVVEEKGIRNQTSVARRINQALAVAGTALATLLALIIWPLVYWGGIRQRRLEGT